MKLMLSIIDRLHRGTDSVELRQLIADDVLRLTKADMLASFVWNEQCQRFEDVVFQNMSASNLRSYVEYFQHRDPITPQLRLRRKATLVSDVMPQEELEKTEFFNDFLQVDGLTYGINLYAYDGEVNMGDLRLWRGLRKDPFTKREVALLEMLKPHFTNALINARTIKELRNKVSGWHDLWELHPNPCVVFSLDGNELHQNQVARQLKLTLSLEDWESLRKQVLQVASGQLDAIHWRDFRLSVIKSRESDMDSAPMIMVQITKQSKLVINHEFILNRFDLTSTEAKLCLWIMRGLSDQAIADYSHRSVWTVRAHMKSIFEKLGIAGRQELAALITSTVAEIQFP
jgi:DNA-binding CsgD family transcriptional regulator